MSNHTALPVEGVVEEQKPERPAAARWHKESDTGKWLVKVRRSVHRPGRAARVTSNRGSKMVALGEIVSDLDDVFVLSGFADNTPKPPRADQSAATEAQLDELRQLWNINGGGRFVNTSAHTLEQPDWDNLTSGDARWYLTALEPR